jgi:hypothetical protein
MAGFGSAGGRRKKCSPHRDARSASFGVLSLCIGSLLYIGVLVRSGSSRASLRAGPASSLPRHQAGDLFRLLHHLPGIDPPGMLLLPLCVRGDGRAACPSAWPPSPGWRRSHPMRDARPTAAPGRESVPALLPRGGGRCVRAAAQAHRFPRRGSAPALRSHLRILLLRPLATVFDPDPVPRRGSALRSAAARMGSAPGRLRSSGEDDGFLGLRQRSWSSSRRGRRAGSDRRNSGGAARPHRLWSGSLAFRHVSRARWNETKALGGFAPRPVRFVPPTGRGRSGSVALPGQ